MKSKTIETKSPILPSCTYVTLKHNITSPDVWCLSVNAYNFKTKTNGPSIVTASEVRASASAIKNYTKELWHKICQKISFKSRFLQSSTGKNTKQTQKTQKQTQKHKNKHKNTKQTQKHKNKLKKPQKQTQKTQKQTQKTQKTNTKKQKHRQRGFHRFLVLFLVSVESQLTAFYIWTSGQNV